MSFGLSPTDVINLVQFSARIYVAFKDANDNSETQVKDFIRQYSSFHQCLEQLGELMKEYGKPLPFPYPDFKETLERCEKTIEPYTTHLVDRRMSVKKVIYTIRYIGKEKELENLRQQITGHYQALQMCINFLQLRLHLEATKQTQRLLDLAPFRAMSIGGQYYTTNALGTSSRTAPNALPAPSEAEDLYNEWLAFSRWLKSEDERLALQASRTARPLSLGGTPATTQNDDEQRAAVLYHLRREVEDAKMIEENRAKRTAVEQRTNRRNLLPSDATRREVRNLPPIPQRTYTIDTNFSGNFTRFDDAQATMSDSTATIRPPSASISPTATLITPSGSPQIPQSYFDPVDWGSVSPTAPSPNDTTRTPSVSTTSSVEGASPGSSSSICGQDIRTAETTPLDVGQSLRRKLSAASLISIALGPGALQWNDLCGRVQVERTSSNNVVESRKCHLHWRYREDAGISIRSLYHSSSSTREVKVWITQHFPATGPSIPLPTSDPDGEVSIEFPRHSYGRLEKRYTDIKYTFADPASSRKFQTLLYTNNGTDAAELLYDRRILTISSNLHKPECRGKNVRLWKRSELQLGPNGMESVDVLVLLFYTSALEQPEKQHWVEEPHYAFQWLDESTYKKSSDKVQLVFSKEPSQWIGDKTFKRRKSSKSSDNGTADAPGRVRLTRSGTVSSSTSTSALSIKSRSSIFDSGRPSMMGNLNRFGYSKLEIEFESKTDRKEFLDIWRQYVKPMGIGAGRYKSD